MSIRGRLYGRCAGTFHIQMIVLPSSNPRSTETLYHREVRVVRDDASSKLHRRCGDDAVRDGHLALATTDSPTPAVSSRTGSPFARSASHFSAASLNPAWRHTWSKNSVRTRVGITPLPVL